ncbi:(R)-specific enoyl-CoA hydratase-like [Chelonus insularis]|uniref:(R)-specific enoyl-CoA hydratase-like n=1 Tax=Chelonus insularis TaxID=460826 RepID=UPI00158D6DB5|nr:(R)-specific enoyl-CoA hydratase-like [Chelonus insularis]
MNYLKDIKTFLNISQKLQILQAHKKLSSSSSSELSRKFEPGQKVSMIRTVTEDDVINFAKLTNDYNPIHLNADKKIVHGALLNGFLSGVLGTKLPGPGTLVVHQLLNYPKPCYAGDVIEISVTVLSNRKIIKCSYKIVANSERVVLDGEGKFVFIDRFSKMT